MTSRGGIERRAADSVHEDLILLTGGGEVELVGDFVFPVTSIWLWFLHPAVQRFIDIRGVTATLREAFDMIAVVGRKS